MRLLADENVPLATVERLRRAGHDVATILEAGAGASDLEVLGRARREARVVLTFDVDFGDLVFRRQGPVPLGVVLFRFVPERPEEPADLLHSILARPEIDLLQRFTVVTREQVRQRPLPVVSE